MLQQCIIKQENSTYEMQQTLDRFLVHLSADGATPAGTLSAYRADLAQCLAYLAEHGITDIQAVRPKDLQAFCAWLHEHGYASATIARRVVALRAFGAFLVHSSILSADPCADLHPPAVTRTLRPSLTRDQIDVLRGLMLRQSTPEGWRDHAMLEVLLATALRASQLVALDVGDLNLEAATLRIRGRGGKSRTIGLPAEAVMAVLAYLQLGRPKLLRTKGSETALFVNCQGQRLTRQGFWVVLKGYARQLGLDELSPELLRQSAVAHRFADGATVEELQALLDHAVRKTTEVYQPTR